MQLTLRTFRQKLFNTARENGVVQGEETMETLRRFRTFSAIVRVANLAYIAASAAVWCLFVTAAFLQREPVRSHQAVTSSIGVSAITKAQWGTVEGLYTAADQALSLPNTGGVSALNTGRRCCRWSASRADCRCGQYPGGG
jgi:hypothetical protein